MNITLTRLLALLLVLAGLVTAAPALGQGAAPEAGGGALLGGRALVGALPEPSPPRPANTPTPRPQPTATPAAEITLPRVRVLGPMAHDYQKMNNCGPVATLMALSYYGDSLPQAKVAFDLRPNPRDVSVSAVEAAQYVRSRGLGAAFRLGGTPELIRRFVANGIPVMAPHLLNDHEDIGHFTVVRGYDLSNDTFVINDSYYGPSRNVPVSEYLQLWEPYERAFVPVYRPAQEPLVRELLGADWDPAANARRYVEEQRRAVAGRRSGETLMSLGYGLYVAGRHAEAVEAYRAARDEGLSRRTLWYTAWPAAALNKTGRYDEALSLANTALAQNPASAEMLVEKANALSGLGRAGEAAEARRLAQRYAPYLPDSRAGLAEGGESGAP